MIIDQLTFVIQVTTASYQHLGFRATTVCESWASIIQLGLAAWILQTQIGVVCITPILIVTGMFCNSSH